MSSDSHCVLDDYRTPPVHVDTLIANADGVQQRFEIESLFLHILHPQVIRNRAEYEHDMIVSQFARGPAFSRDSDLAGLKFNFADFSANHLRAPQTGAERS